MSLRALEQRTVTVLGRTFRVAELFIAAATALGLLLALPSIASPTSRLVLSDPGRGSVISDERTWSWGQVSQGNPGGFERTFTDAAGLSFLVAALVVGVAAMLFWMLRPSPVGCLLGVLGVTVPTVYLAGTVIQRLGLEREQEYGLTGLGVQSELQPAAVSEVAAAVLLALSLVAMVLLTLRSPHRLGRFAGRLGQGHEPTTGPVDEPHAEATSPSDTQVDGIRTARDATTAAPGGPRLDGPGAGFRDEPPDWPQRPRRPDHRFEPPR